MASSTPDASSDDEREDVEQSIGEEEELEEESKYQNSEQDEEDESEEEEEVVQRKPVVLKHTPASESNQDSDSDSDSDLAETQTAPAFTIRPSTKPKEKSPKPKTLTSKSTSAKRPLEETKPDDATGSAMGSKKKKSKISNGDEEKKTAILRLFSDDDVIAILKGMDDYQRKKGLNPNANMASFLEFVKGSLKVVVSKSQLSEKIRRLKKKYQNNVAKGEDGKDPIFSKPHEHNLFRLSKRFWGGGVVGLTGNGMEDSKKKDNGNGVDDSKVTSSKKKDNGKVVSDSVAKVINDSAVAEEVVAVDENKEEEQKDFWSMYPRLSESLEPDSSIYLLLPKDAENFVKERMSLIGREKASQLEEKWKDILVMEYELYAKRLELIHEQVQLVVDEMKPSKS